MQHIDPATYSSQLSEKVTNLQKLMDDFAIQDIQVFESQPLHFRMRAEFRVWHQDDRCFHAMFHKGNNKTPYEVTDFPIACTRINDTMPALMSELNQNETLKTRLFQIEYLATLSNQLLVTLVYHRKLDETWEAEAKNLENKLGIHVIGRSRKQKVVISQDFVIEALPLKSGVLKYKQIEGGFTQPNANINIDMLEWTRDAAGGMGGDLLELYCGNGNFTLALADRFNSVVATEISKTSIHAAEYNKDINGVSNVDFARMSAEEFTQAMQGVREFRRLSHIDLKDKNFTTVFVDPPRAGLDEESCKMIQAYDNIIYISCNPNTLKDNLLQLSQSHEIVKMAAFDQFPYTDHLECGVILKRK